MTVTSSQNYAFPFRLDPGTGRTSQADYAAHVDQMIRQILLTDPGERVDLPNFGAGLRRLVFKPISEGLAAATQLLVRQSLERWLAGVIQVVDVIAESSDDPGAPVEQGELLITVSYVLLDTLASATTQVRLI